MNRQQELYVARGFNISGGFILKNQKEQQLLALMEEAFKVANHMNMDAKTMVSWLREKIQQDEYRLQNKEQAL